MLVSVVHLAFYLIIFCNPKLMKNGKSWSTFDFVFFLFLTFGMLIKCLSWNLYLEKALGSLESSWSVQNKISMKSIFWRKKIIMRSFDWWESSVYELFTVEKINSWTLDWWENAISELLLTDKKIQNILAVENI